MAVSVHAVHANSKFEIIDLLGGGEEILNFPSSPLDRPITVTVFPDRFALSAKEGKQTFHQIAAAVQKRRAPTKKRLPLLKLARFGGEKTDKGSLRHDANLLAITGVEADYDGGQMSVDEAAIRLRAAGISALLYTSPSHTDAAPHWRALFPLFREHPPESRAALLARANGALGGILSSESFTLSQSYFYGAVGSKPAPRVELVDGRFLDNAYDLDAGAVGREGPIANNDDVGDLATLVGNQRTDLSSEEFASAVREIRNDERFGGRDVWLGVLAAIHHETGGSVEGFVLADEFSRKWTCGKYDEDATRAAWNSFRDKPDRPLKTGAYILQLAQQDGWKNPASVRRENTVGGDIQNGRLFAARYKGAFRHVLANDQWLRWDGSRWTHCHNGEEVEAAKALAGDMLKRTTDDLRAATTDVNKAHHKKATALFNDGWRLRAMLGMARSEPALVTEPGSFDTDPMLIGVRNGVLDLRTGLIAPDPSQLISKQVGAQFDPDARCPRWLRFLEDVQPEADTRQFLQRAVGYTLSGLVDEEKLFFAHGTGSNGKSVFANILLALMGDYGLTVGAALLTRNRYESEAARLITRLPGARVALANETKQGDIWDDQRVKELASRERIAARKLYKEGFDFWPTHKLWIRGNHLPGALDAGDAFWRRMVPIAFRKQFDERERIPDLDRQIIATEMAGVLNWAVEGCLLWRRDGLKIPAAIRQETRQYREDTDLLGQWMHECCTVTSNGRTTVADAYGSYRVFCVDQGVAVPSKIMFGRQMTGRGIHRSEVRRDNRAFEGFVLKTQSFDLL